MEWLAVITVLAVSFSGVFGDASPRLSPEDRETLRRLGSPRASLPAGFKYKYVGSGGVIRSTKSSGHWVEVAASPKTTETGHYEAALIVSKMTRHMPSAVFAKLSSGGSVGVFTRSEGLTIYPEYYRLKDTPECRGSCSGHCSASCTFDGRKWTNVAGAGGARAVILDDNVMCTSRDPYYHHENILVHEFTHTIHHHALDSTHYAQINAAYNHAKSANLWVHSAYAMANYEEYFAEGATAYFNVNQESSAAGMNKCGGGHYCTSENAARNWLHKHDIQLYGVLTYVFTNNHPDTPSHLAVCQKS
ncbi:uncharacterized protein LOC124286086 [Haliotis rubra]|uniref:uncharacterized protein LOC124286086 n=1 Tax=Haliotis rubra TaxID=36100 RepID=UPI001EE5740E|nr:uncharacterized protein LOC124286086 [Haliotis rubra]